MNVRANGTPALRNLTNPNEARPSWQPARSQRTWPSPAPASSSSSAAAWPGRPAEMSSTRSRGRVAVAATLLAGSGTAWATCPQATAAPSLAGPVARPGQTLLTAPATQIVPSQGPCRRGHPRPVDRNQPPEGPAGRSPSRCRPRASPLHASGSGCRSVPSGWPPTGRWRYRPTRPTPAGADIADPPGGSAGATVLAAHIDASGPLARLGELRRGDVLTVLAGGTSRLYLVSSTRSPRDQAPAARPRGRDLPRRRPRRCPPMDRTGQPDPQRQLDLEQHGERTTHGVFTRVAERLPAMVAGIWLNWNIGVQAKRSLTAYHH